MAIEFEGVKVGMRQNKDGYMLTICVHPNDLSNELITAWVGSRYRIKMIQIGDDEKPVVDKEAVTNDRVMKAAVMLCKQPSFWRYMADANMAEFEPVNEEEAASALKNYLGIKSRTEIRDRKEPREAMGGVLGEFIEWKKRNPGS